MHGIHDERPDTKIVPMKVAIDSEEIRRLLPVFNADADARTTAASMGLQRDMPLPEQLNIWITVPGDCSQRAFRFTVKLVAQDECQINFVLFQCATQCLMALGTLAGCTTEATDEYSYEFFVLVVEPTLHTTDSGDNLVVQAIVCIKDDESLDSVKLAREAVRQLLAVS